MTLKQAPGPRGPVPNAGSEVERGMVLMTVAVLIAPGTHALAKTLGETMAPGQISWARFVFQILFLLPLVWVAHAGRIPPPALADAVRGALLAAGSFLFFWALSLMPLAESVAIFFVEPLILTLMSAAFLGETIGWRRILAVIVGFIGALIVIRPSFDDVGPAAFLPLMSAVCFATYLTITRSRAESEEARAMQFWISVFGALVMAVALVVSSHLSWEIAEPSWPTGREWLLLPGLGIVATGSHMLAIAAFRRAPASLLAPLQYLEILSATTLGLVIFGDWPDEMTLLGTAVIVGSGLYVFRREQAASRR